MEHDDCTYSDHDYVEGHNVLAANDEHNPRRDALFYEDVLTDEQKKELQVRGNPEHLLSSLIGTTAVPPDMQPLVHCDPGDETMTDAELIRRATRRTLSTERPDPSLLGQRLLRHGAARTPDPGRIR